MVEMKKAKKNEKLPMLVIAACCWPMGFVVLGGLIGGLLGGIACAVNIALYRSSLPRWSLWLLNPLVGLVALVLYLVIIVVLVMIFPSMAE